MAKGNQTDRFKRVLCLRQTLFVQEVGTIHSLLDWSHLLSVGEIELRLNIEPDEYIDVLSPEHGAIIFIHTQESNLRDGQQHMLAPGSSYIIDLQKVSTI